MVQDPLFLEPVFKERIWGGTALKERFAYNITSERTGECWGISAHPNGPSKISNGLLKGKTLGELWDQHSELFGNYPGKVFPLLVKIIDANTNLSVQVHPDDHYAKLNENGELGKTECWYILDCKEDAEIILGHHAKNKEELEYWIENGQWDEMLQRVKIKPGDFIFVPSGTIHALCEGTVVMEIQQSSDTTYRVYDYNRKDSDGKQRELHLDKALEVITVPHHWNNVQPTVMKQSGAVITTFIESEYFSVYKWAVDGISAFNHNQYFLLGSVMEGEGEIATKNGAFPLKKGDHFFIPNNLKTFSVKGSIDIIVSHV
jgi:mannose-6-phosphate isomerase